jgi:hypothetical protein
MFRTVSLSIIRSYSLYTQQWYMSYRQLSSSRLSLLLESCLQTCMAYTIAECTVNSSWWWREKLSETYRVPVQNRFEKLVYLVAFILRKWSKSVCSQLPSSLTYHTADIFAIRYKLHSFGETTVFRFAVPFCCLQTLAWPISSLGTVLIELSVCVCGFCLVRYFVSLHSHTAHCSDVTTSTLMSYNALLFSAHL